MPNTQPYLQTVCICNANCQDGIQMVYRWYIGRGPTRHHPAVYTLDTLIVV